MPSELNRFFPRKRKWAPKSKGKGLATPSSGTNIAEEYKVSTITLFARGPMLVRDLFVKSVYLKKTASDHSVKVSRAYREQEDSVRYEDSNIACTVLMPEQILHLCDIFMTENFGVQIEISDGHFLVNSVELPTDLVVLHGALWRTVKTDVRATPVSDASKQSGAQTHGP